MPSSYSSNLRLELITAGEQANTWGNTTNTNLGTLLESAIAGRVELSAGWAANSITLSAFNGANDQARQMCLVVPSATISANSTIIVPASAVTASSGKLYTVINKSLSYSVTIKLAASTGVTIPANTAKTVVYNGTDFQEAFTAHDLLTLTGTPTTATHAVNKGYVDTKFFSIADDNTVTGNTTFTGTVTLPTATPTGNQATSYNYVNTNYLWKASGVTSQIMNPYLRLNYTPSDPADAVHKSYVDSSFVGLSNVQTISGAKTFSGSVSLSGTAALTLANDPLADMQASTKKYVDDQISAAVGGAGSLYALKSTTIYAGTGVELNGTSFATLDDDITITLVGGGTVTSVTATAPLAATGTTAVNISMPPATAAQSGYLLSTAYDAFDKKCNANGSNATGTWTINITGSAGSASSVAWAGVTGRPTAVSAFTNDAGYLTGVSWSQVSGRPTALSQFTNDTNFINSGYVSSYVNQYAVLKAGSTMTGALNVQNSLSPSKYISVNTVAVGGNYYPAVVAINSGSSAYPDLAFAQYSTSLTYQVPLIFGPTGQGTFAYDVVLTQLAAGGSVSAVAGTGRLIISSDANLKVADGYIENPQEILDSLIPRYFYWKDENGAADHSQGRQLGFYAQEVQAAVVEASPSGKGIYDRALIAVLVAAVKELKAEIASLKGA